MNLAIVYDTETTDKIDFKGRSSDPAQPHIVQLAAALIDLDTQYPVSVINLIVKPEGWTIPQETTDIHGISTEMALEVGIPEREVLEMFLRVWGGRLRIAHNDSFDARIIRIAMKRFFSDDNETFNEWENCEKFCTLHNSKPILKLPPTEAMKRSRFKNCYKPPNLGEAYKFFTDQDLEGAHNAMIDVEACAAVYFGIKDHEQG